MGCLTETYQAVRLSSLECDEEGVRFQWSNLSSITALSLMSRRINWIISGNAPAEIWVDYIPKKFRWFAAWDNLFHEQDELRKNHLRVFLKLECGWKGMQDIGRSELSAWKSERRNK